MKSEVHSIYHGENHYRIKSTCKPFREKSMYYLVDLALVSMLTRMIWTCGSTFMLRCTTNNQPYNPCSAWYFDLLQYFSVCRSSFKRNASHIFECHPMHEIIYIYDSLCYWSYLQTCNVTVAASHTITVHASFIYHVWLHNHEFVSQCISDHCSVCLVPMSYGMKPQWNKEIGIGRYIVASQSSVAG
jgi:hypothetical protein